MVQSLQPNGREFESTHVLVSFVVVFIYLFLPLFDSFNFVFIDVPRPLSNFL